VEAVKAIAPLALLVLAACGRPDAAEDGAASNEPILTPSPDTTGAVWTTSANGLAIQFGQNPAAPYVSLACHLSTKQQPQLTIIRHAPSEPGAKALFAVLGNGIAARFKVDAALAGREGWRWEATLPASAGEFDVFTGPREIEATLPGAGMIKFPASGLPGEFVDWCRRGGKALPVPESETPQPPQTRSP
jgi:hypothetical protein